MRSCLGLIASLFVFILVVGGGAALFYLSSTTEFSRSDSPAASNSESPAK